MSGSEGAQRLQALCGMQLPETLSPLDLHALLDGELGGRRRRDVEIAAEADPAMAHDLAALRQQKSLLRDVRRALGDLDSRRFEPLLQQRLAVVVAHRRRTRRRIAQSLAAAVAALLVAGGGVAWWRDQPVREPLRQAELPTEFLFGRSFAATSAGLPAGGGAESLAWLRQYVPPDAIRLADLEALGLRLAGGGVLTSVSSPAVHLVFIDAGQQPISLYVGIVSRSVRAALAQVPEGHLSMHWRQGNLLFALVGAVESPRLVEIMGRVTAGLAGHGTQTLAAQGAALPTKEGAVAGPLQPAVLPTEPVARERAGNVAPAGPAASPAVAPVAPSRTAEPKAL